MTGLDHARIILGYEARRDEKGRVRLYRLPASDGGGKWEYAGINERYHPHALARICSLMAAGKHQEAEEFAVQYIEEYTRPASLISNEPALQFALRDICWNRGLGGARKTFQMALGVVADGQIGPKTKAAQRLAERAPFTLLKSIRDAREKYERVIVGRNEKSEFWTGLKNRWIKQMLDAQEML